MDLNSLNITEISFLVSFPKDRESIRPIVITCHFLTLDDPSLSWSAGCQMVALNFQTPGTHLWINEGKFLQNGNSGYILKPSVMRSPGKVSWNPMAPTQLGTVSKLTVEVISARQLPKKSRGTKGELLDPYVVVKLAGLKSASLEFRTNVIQGNGFNPKWNQVCHV